MKNYPLNVLLLAMFAAGFGGNALAKNSGATNPPPPALTITRTAAFPEVPLMTATQEATATTPVLISGVQSTAKSFAVFFINQKRVSMNLAMSLLKGTIGPEFQPCAVTIDLNATPVNCGSGLVQFGSNEVFTAKDSVTPGLSELPLRFDPSNAANEVYLANYRTPQDTTGVTVHVHFNTRVSQFLMRVGSGQLAAHSIHNLKFTIGTDPGGPSVTQVLAPDDVNLGAEWVGVQVAAGTTDLWITPDADLDQYLATDDPIRTTLTHAWNADLISVVPTSVFTPQP